MWPLKKDLSINFCWMDLLIKSRSISSWSIDLCTSIVVVPRCQNSSAWEFPHPPWDCVDRGIGSVFSINMHRMLWLKAWSAVAACKRLLTCMPFEGRCLLCRAPQYTTSSEPKFISSFWHRANHFFPKTFFPVKGHPHAYEWSMSVTVCSSPHHRSPRPVSLISGFKGCKIESKILLLYCC